MMNMFPFGLMCGSGSSPTKPMCGHHPGSPHWSLRGEPLVPEDGLEIGLVATTATGNNTCLPLSVPSVC